MLPVAAAGLQAVSSGFGFLSSGNYVRLAKTAGREARATIQCAGQETRATIEKADVAAQAVLGRMGTEVRRSIDLAQSRVVETLRLASTEARQVIGEANIEARHTSAFMRLQVEHILATAAKESENLLDQAGLEARRAIALGGQEAKETCLLLSNEVNTQIQEAGQKAMQVLNEGKRNVSELLNQATREVQELTLGAGAECERIISNTIESANTVFRQMAIDADQKLKDLIRLVGQEANGVILNLGEQGRLLIQQSGQEIRASANEILTRAFNGQEVLIEAAGIECRMTAQAMGRELRLTLKELPAIAGLTAEVVGRNFAHGLKDGIWGISEGKRIIHDIRNLLSNPEGFSVENVIRFIGDQNQLSPYEKYLLYREFVQILNKPFLEREQREYLHVMIGVSALNDRKLQSSYCGLWTKHYGEDLIHRIPGNACTILETHRHLALEKGFKQDIVEVIAIEAPNTLELQIAEQEVRARYLQNDVEKWQRQARIVELQRVDAQQAVGGLLTRLQDVEQQATIAHNQVVKLEATLRQERGDNEELRSQITRLGEQLRLCNTINQ